MRPNDFAIAMCSISRTITEAGSLPANALMMVLLTVGTAAFLKPGSHPLAQHAVEEKEQREYLGARRPPA